ncbi:MAG TPA: GNAT family N-acetyltransferase [Vicinamibacterales bacterium]
MSEIAAVTGVELESILDATHTIWHDGLTRPAYSRLYAAHVAAPWGRRGLTRWALVDRGEVLASAKIYMFNATLDGQTIRIAGFGAVFTLPAHRGRGAARELMTRLVDKVAAEGADAALLFSEIGPDYYARLGFFAVPLDDLSIRVIEDARRGAPATMVRAGDDRDLDAVVAMDAARAERFRFHLNRDRDLAHFAIAKRRILAGLSAAGARSLQFFVAEEGASVVAYAVVYANGGVWTIDSCGDRDPAGARLGAVLQVLIAREPAEHRPAIVAWLPATLRPPQLEITARAASRDLMMFKPLSGRANGLASLSPSNVLFWKGDAF